MSYSLPRYYFHDLPAEIIDQLVHGMENLRPGTTWEEIEHWLSRNNHAATIPAWYDRVGEVAFRIS